MPSGPVLRWGLAFFAFLPLLIAGPGDAAPAGRPAPVGRSPRSVESGPPRTFATAKRGAFAPDDDAHSPRGPAVDWARSLAAVEIKNRNTDTSATLRLYAEDGSVDPFALRAFVHVACSQKDAPDAGASEPLEPRLVQLVFRAAYHFGAKRVILVSATRKDSRGKHASGEAIDFQLDGVKAGVLAAYLRTMPRAGVGIYTHPKTQYAHLDVRDHSYHWIDASPPHVSWRERLLPDPKQAKRDASWTPAMDLPETARAN